MLKPLPSRGVLWPLIQHGLVSLLLVFGTAYALLDNDLFLRAGLVLDRAARSLSAASTELRLRSLSSKMQESWSAFEELRGHRDVLDVQIRELEARQLNLALCLRQEEDTLQTVLALLSNKGTAGEPQFSRPEIERDAAELLWRVEIRRTELREYEATLSRLTEAREVLDRKLSGAHGSLCQQCGKLEREQVDFTGRQAYSQALDAARRVETATRNWERQPSLSLNP
jgi:chromosome segregation ATPase